jgi:ketosteroid isomerase-like protein
MALSAQDRIDITDLINLHGHLTDAGDLDRLDELFTQDVTYDVTDFGFGALHGTAAIREAALALGDANPLGHHVTNIVITEIDERSARVRCKGIGIMADGTTGSAVYDDVVTRGPEGWRISHRKVTARRVALGGARAVLERFRRASVNQSTEDLVDVYATDAIHEFPFTVPGLPSRLEGRDQIVNWIADGWQTNGLRYERYRTLAIHDTDDPATIVVEQEAIGSDFTLPNIVVLTTRGGRITHLRDYVNIPAAMAVIGGQRDGAPGPHGMPIIHHA